MPKPFFSTRPITAHGRPCTTFPPLHTPPSQRVLLPLPPPGTHFFEGQVPRAQPRLLSHKANPFSLLHSRAITTQEDSLGGESCPGVCVRRGKPSDAFPINTPLPPRASPAAAGSLRASLARSPTAGSSLWDQPHGSTISRSPGRLGGSSKAVEVEVGPFPPLPPPPRADQQAPALQARPAGDLERVPAPPGSRSSSFHQQLMGTFTQPAPATGLATHFSPFPHLPAPSKRNSCASCFGPEARR